MKYLINYSEYNNIKGGGCFDVWCPLCGGPLNVHSLHDKEFTNISNQLNWLKKVSILFEGKKVKHGFFETSCNTKFKNKSGESYSYLVEKDNGIPLHTECYKLAKIKTGKKLCFEDFDIDKFWINTKYSEKMNTKKIINKEISTLSYQNLKKFYFESKLAKYIYYAYSDLNYNPILKYWKQDFDLATLKNKKSEWYLLFNPNGKSDESKKNADRIIKNIKKLKKNLNRPSPPESATQFNKGTKKKGNDGNMYIIVINKNKVKRWKKL